MVVVFYEAERQGSKLLVLMRVEVKQFHVPSCMGIEALSLIHMESSHTPTLLLFIS